MNVETSSDSQACFCVVCFVFVALGSSFSSLRVALLLSRVDRSVKVGRTQHHFLFNARHPQRAAAARKATD